MLSAEAEVPSSERWESALLAPPVAAVGRGDTGVSFGKDEWRLVADCPSPAWDFFVLAFAEALQIPSTGCNTHAVDDASQRLGRTLAIDEAVGFM